MGELGRQLEALGDIDASTLANMSPEYAKELGELVYGAMRRAIEGGWEPSELAMSIYEGGAATATRLSEQVRNRQRLLLRPKNRETFGSTFGFGEAWRNDPFANL